MIHKVPYKVFFFKKPEEIDRYTFFKLKTLLKTNPKINISPKTKFKEVFENEIGILKFTLYCILTSILMDIIGPLLKIKILSELSIIPVGLGLTFFAYSLFLSIIPSGFSYISFKLEKNKYFKTLKEDIINSSDYLNFQEIRKNNSNK